MDILDLKLNNFLTISEAEIELAKRGLLLIQGVNLDDTSARSNGAGKSSIVDGLCWCYYGTTARNETGDDIVNEAFGKDCGVISMLQDGGTFYRIERYRKHSKFKNQLLAFEATSPAGPWTDLSKGTDRETQIVVDKILGCSFEVFVGAIYAGQEQMPNLPGMTDKQLKLMIEEAAGVEILADAHALAQKRSLEAVKALSSAQATLEAQVAAEAAAKALLTEATEQVKLFNDTRKDRARDDLALTIPLTAKSLLLSGQLAALDESGLAARQAELTSEIAGLRGQQEENIRLSGQLITARNDEATSMRAHESSKKRRAQLVLDLDEINTVVGTPCGECGKPYCERDLETTRVFRQASIDEFDAKIKSAESALNVAKQASVEAEQALEAFRASMTDSSAAGLELSQVNAKLTEAVRISGELSTIQSSIAAHKAAAVGRMKETNPWDAALVTRELAANQAIAKTAVSAAKVEELTTAAELIADAVRVFGPAGVRAHILDTVTPYLNERTSDYLGVLADGNIHAAWNTLTKTAKGEMKEKFNIEVTNDRGGRKFGLQSGGEKRKVRLACALALQDMTASRATKPINLFMADEIDDALDEPGLERLMSVLDKKSKGGTVLVISHNALSDWIDNVITVTKTARGQSTISGSTAAGL